MSLDVHRRAEMLMGRADRLLAEGRPDEAAGLHYEAAAAEAEVFRLLPPDRPRTRGVTAVSCVALFRKAGSLDQAIRQAHLFLGRDDLPDFARQDLDEMLDEMRAEQLANMSGRTLGEGSFEWILRGPHIGPGLAPLPVIAKQIDQIAKYGARVFECQAGSPVRKSGPVPPAIMSAFDMVMSQPYEGSFRFQIRFSTPMKQLTLFDTDKSFSPAEIGSFFGDILEATADENPKRLEELVEDPQYRDVFLRSLRSMLPNGKDLSTVDIIGHGGFSHTVMTLTPAMSKGITGRLSSGASELPPGNSRVDILRGLDLNEGWIHLGKEQGREQRCYVREGVVLADMVHDLIDQPVRVTGVWERRGKTRRFYVDDLEAAEVNADEITQPTSM